MSEPNEKSKQESCGCGCCGGKGMSGKAWLIVAIILLLVVALALWSNAAVPAPAEPAASAVKPAAVVPTRVAALYPELAVGALHSATVAELEPPVILKSTAVTMTQADFDAEIAKAPAALQPKLKAQPLFLLEQLVTRQLLLAEVRAAAKAAGQTVGPADDKALIQAELGKIVKDVVVSDAEAKQFYDANVLFVSVREEQILAGRYGIQSIPVQILFDKGGKEVWRHAGFIPQAELEKTIADKL